jgi:uncharacterized spore protein YtfJ
MDSQVIDSRVGYTGGFGIDDKRFGDGRTNGARITPRATLLAHEPILRYVKVVAAVSSSRISPQADASSAIAGGLRWLV